MSLKVWMPLDGNLTQQGASGATFTNNDATVSANGKIGKCYAFSGSSQYLHANYNFYSPQYSVCAWVYSTSASATQGLICDRMSAGNGFAVFLIGGKIRIDPGGEAIIWTTNYTYPTDTWFHLGITYDGTKVSYYINGEFQQEYAYALDESFWGSITSIGASQSNGSSYNNYLRGQLNDIRIYDHCLSAAEVHEISQGLVLHYRLDQNITVGENIMPNSLNMPLGSANPTTGTWRTAGSNNMTRSRVAITDTPEGSGYGFQNSGIQTANDGSCYGIDSFPLEANTNYVISMWARITEGTEGYAGFNVYSSTPIEGWQVINKNYYSTRLATDGSWTRCWMSFKTNAATTRNIYIGITTGSTSVTTQMCNIHIEKGLLVDSNIIKDSSGYGYHGTVTGTLSNVADTPRYATAATSSAAATIINATSTIPTTLTTLRQYSFGIWVKTNATNNRYIYSMGTGTGTARGFWLTTNGSKPHFAYNGSGAFTATKVVNDNVWHHVFFTVDDVTSKCYVDGVLCGSSTNTSTTIAGNNEIKVIFNGSDSCSDFRIYCTALSAEDILALYHTGAKIDNKGGVHTFEFNETSGSKITKSGITKFNFIGENINYNQKTEIGKQIHPNLLKGSNQIGDMTIGKYGWISNGSASNIELLHDNIIHYSYNLSNTNRIPSITTNSAIACELGKTYTYTMELKCDQAIRLGTNVPMHFWAGARTTNVDTNTSCNGHLSGITYDYVLNHDNSTLPENTWVKIVTRITYPTSISESNYPYPALRCYVYGSVLPAAYTGEVNIWMRNCKVEEGTESTPWVPHADDGCASIVDTEPGWLNGTQLIEF